MKWGNDDAVGGCRGILSAVALVFALTMVVMAGCVAPAGGASLAYPEPYPAPQDTTPLSLTRTGPTTAELCAPAGIVFAKLGSQYRVAYDAWPGGCAEIGARNTFTGGDIYCIQVSPSPPSFVCTDPLPRWWRMLYLPVVFR